jgi:redox-sensing transcriptional repressor
MVQRGRAVVSCTHIAEELRLDPTQVRKDLAATGIVGKPKVGYEVTDLLQHIESLLGWNDTSQAFLVGVGSLGTALLGYNGFQRYGLDIVAAFDSSPDKIGTEVHGRKVLAISKLPDLATRMCVNIGIITTPGDAAQSVADLMIQGGIRAIWTFAPASLRVPDHIIVQHEELSSSIAVLTKRLKLVLNPTISSLSADTETPEDPSI